MEAKTLKTKDMKQYRKEYYQKHKDTINKNKICGVCGKTYNTSTRWRHFKSNKHKILELEKKVEELKKVISLLQQKFAE